VRRGRPGPGGAHWCAGRALGEYSTVHPLQVEGASEEDSAALSLEDGYWDECSSVPPPQGGVGAREAYSTAPALLGNGEECSTAAGASIEGQTEVLERAAGVRGGREEGNGALFKKLIKKLPVPECATRGGMASGEGVRLRGRAAQLANSGNVTNSIDCRTQTQKESTPLQ